MSTKLKFREDGTFKVLQITDIHGLPQKTPDTLRLIEGTLDQEKPDLVVFTGDQIKGYGLSYMSGDRIQKVHQAIHNFIETVESRGIPFLVTFGNHDPQVGVSNAEQMEMYCTYDTCVQAEESFVYGPGTYCVPVYTSDEAKPAMNIYMIDSGGSAPGGGYESVDPEKIEWYKSVRDQLHAQWGGYIPSIIFQHIPVPEIYNLYDEVDKNHPDAIKMFRTHKGQYYKLKDEFVYDDVRLYEPSAIADVNTGEFDAVKECGDVFAMLFGHDHQNNFIGSFEGVDMGYGPSCGFTEYGNGVERGIRVLKFRQSDPRKYESYIITYRQLFGERVIKPAQKSFYDQIPTSFDAAIPLIVKGVAGIAVVVTAGVVLGKMSKKRRKKK